MSSLRLAAILGTAILISLIFAGPGYLRWWDAHEKAKAEAHEKFLKEGRWRDDPIVVPAN